jgi:hypothetical protein
MQVRIVLLVGLSGLVGWVARGEPVAAPALAAPPPQIVYVPAPVVHVREPAAPEPVAEEEEENESAGEDLGELLARVQQQAAPTELPHNAVHGRTIDPTTGEASVGVTIVASSEQLEGTRAVVSDETGGYALSDLPAGSYTLTFYYGDVTVERTNVTVSSLASALVDQQIGLTSYIKNIPIPERTFEGVSFSGTTSLENTYYIDGIDTTDLQFGEE